MYFRNKELDEGQLPEAKMMLRQSFWSWELNSNSTKLQILTSELVMTQLNQLISSETLGLILIAN